MSIEHGMLKSDIGQNYRMNFYIDKVDEMCNLESIDESINCVSLENTPSHECQNLTTETQVISRSINNCKPSFRISMKQKKNFSKRKKKKHYRKVLKDSLQQNQKLNAATSAESTGKSPKMPKISKDKNHDEPNITITNIGNQVIAGSSISSDQDRLEIPTFSSDTIDHSIYNMPNENIQNETEFSSSLQQSPIQQYISSYNPKCGALTSPALPAGYMNYQSSNSLINSSYDYSPTIQEARPINYNTRYHSPMLPNENVQSYMNDPRNSQFISQMYQPCCSRYNNPYRHHAGAPYHRASQHFLQNMKQIYGIPQNQGNLVETSFQAKMYGFSYGTPAGPQQNILQTNPYLLNGAMLYRNNPHPYNYSCSEWQRDSGVLSSVENKPLTSIQLSLLETEFERSSYPSKSVLAVCAMMDLSETFVKNWFRNRRRKFGLQTVVDFAKQTLLHREKKQ